ncbi:TMhelix containing protein [Vibrio phage 1.138.O._10N.261.48.A1]|nr:TMhelix containing protein [Vibrio phage 1.138.O._10N.261.48.A1]
MKAEIKQAFKQMDWEHIFKLSGGIAGALMLIGMMKSGMDDIENNVRMMRAAFFIFVSLFALIFIALMVGDTQALINQKRRVAERIEKSKQDLCLWSNDDIPTMTDRELELFAAGIRAKNISKRAGRKISED